MIPRCWPQNASGYMKVYDVGVAGTVPWSTNSNGYIPVKEVSVGADDSYSGEMSVEVLSDITGLVAWVDYIPVVSGEYSGRAFSTDADGYIPVVVKEGAFGGFSVTDTFERADASSLGANYTAVGFDNGLTIASNKAVGVSSSSRSSIYTGATFADDQFVEVVYGKSLGSEVPGVIVRASGGIGTMTGYRAIFTSGSWRLQKYINGIQDGSDVGTGAASNPTTGTVIRLEIEGTSLRLYQNTVLITSATVTGINSGSPGMGGFSDTSFETATFGDL